VSRLSTKQRRAGRRRRRWCALVTEGRAIWAEHPTELWEGFIFGRGPLPASVAIVIALGRRLQAGVTTPSRRWYSLEVQP
jgi:hypothetical protein